MNEKKMGSKRSKKLKGDRIFWRDFQDTPAYRRMQRLLNRNGHRLHVVLNKDDIATDVFIVANKPNR